MKRNATIPLFVIMLGIAGVLMVYKITEMGSNPIIRKNPRTFSNSVPTSTLGNTKPVSFPLTVPQGFKIGVFANGINSARDLTLSPEGTILVSSPTTGSVYALPDKNNDGVVDEVKEIITNRDNPHGIAFYNNKLYVVEQSRVTFYDWIEQKLEALNQAELFPLPSGGNHNKYSITFDKKGTMYISLGSTCNVCNERHPWRATIIATDTNRTNPKIYAKGLRNAPFLTINPTTNTLWATEMGRDWLGDTTPPDEINIVEDGKDYGWPICYGNKIHDTNFDKKKYVRNPCEDTIEPVFEIPAHSAPLGLTFINSNQMPQEWQGDLLVAYHGSWNRTKPTGYKIVRMNVDGNTVVGVEDFITGFIANNAKSGNDALGRPVDLIFDKKGNLYISDDKAGAVYIVYRE